MELGPARRSCKESNGCGTVTTSSTSSTSLSRAAPRSMVAWTRSAEEWQYNCHRLYVITEKKVVHTTLAVLLTTWHNAILCTCMLVPHEVKKTKKQPSVRCFWKNHILLSMEHDCTSAGGCKKKCNLQCNFASTMTELPLWLHCALACNRKYWQLVSNYRNSFRVSFRYYFTRYFLLELFKTHIFQDQRISPNLIHFSGTKPLIWQRVVIVT